MANDQRSSTPVPFEASSQPPTPHFDQPDARGLLASLRRTTPEDEFTIAAKSWIDRRTIVRKLRPTTEQSYRQYIAALGLFFTGYRLRDIDFRDFTKYQFARLKGEDPFIRYRRPQDAKARVVNGVETPPKGKTPCPAKPKKINQELSLLKCIMQSAQCWTEELEGSFEYLLDDEDEIPRALSVEEQRTWLDVARRSEKWEIVHLYSILAFDTGMSTNEIRSIRLGDINMQQGVIRVPRQSAKVRQRERTIPVGLELSDAPIALERLIDRSTRLGSRDHGHHLFPWRTSIGNYDPTKCMSESGIKVAWNEVRSATGLTWFRQYDTRHTAITRMAERGYPLPIIKSKVGHISNRMNEHYTHISEAAQHWWSRNSPNPFAMHARQWEPGRAGRVAR